MMEKNGFLGQDMQKSKPKTPISLTRVGITNLRRMIRIASPGHDTLFFAEMDLYAHLSASRAGVHMSRFLENIEKIAIEMATESTPSIESLAERMALAIAQTQDTRRSEVRIRAQFPERKVTPVSQVEVENLYTFIGIAASDGVQTRHVIGVEVDGLTVCPCAREMVAEQSRKALEQEGYSAQEAARIVDLLPLASHNQRGRGTLLLGTDRKLQAEQLVRLAEASMSSDIYELLKRPDELYIVDRAHRNPRFVEDVAREMIHNVLKAFPDLSDETFLLARQENFESIHVHNACAERYGLLGEMRSELSGNAAPRPPVSMDEWLAQLF